MSREPASLALHRLQERFDVADGVSPSGKVAGFLGKLWHVIGVQQLVVEILSNVGAELGLGGVLLNHHSILEFLSFQDMHNHF